MKLTPFLCVAAMATSAFAAVTPPAGFTALYNGRDLSGWRGGDTLDHRKYLALPEAARAKQDAEWTADMQKHWRADGDELVNDGHGKYATTVKEYGDIELLVDYKTVPLADSGIYLRGVPQVQIWDYTEKAKFNLGADKGSGGLWNNAAGSPGKDPLVKADKPFGEWNHFRILMVGARVSVWLNGRLVVDHALLQNGYYDKTGQAPIPARGPIELQTHGGEIRWKNVFVREIGSDEANQILVRHGEPRPPNRIAEFFRHLLRPRPAAGENYFKSVFNGRDFAGWSGPIENYQVVDGAIQCRPQKGGVIFTQEEFADFVVRLEFKLPPGGNNGLAIRYPGTGDTAYEGMCECQVLDDHYEQATGHKIDPRQAHGSVYGMIPAARGYQHPIGEWNFEEVTVKGSTIKVELNGTVILDGDVAKVTEFMANHPHPGKDRTSGAFGFAGHNDPVAFRNIRIKRL
jgi:hypothetical protein